MAGRAAGLRQEDDRPVPVREGGRPAPEEEPRSRALPRGFTTAAASLWEWWPEAITTQAVGTATEIRHRETVVIFCP